MVYLEEDCDASLFINKLKELDITYVFTDKICNKDWGGHDWYYGDVMEGKVNAEIKKLKVVR